jgi:signal transduction histidine kinase/ligand-binding sensor domain-containing protein
MRLRRSNRLAALILAAVLSAGWGSGAAMAEASSWLHRAWQTDEGLPDNSVTGITQTRDGYLWVATLGGLMRFNGADFKAIPLLNLPGVPNRVVRAMFLDRQDRLWLGMDRGPVICLGPDSARAFSAKEGLPDARVVAMAQDQEGAIWVAFSSGLYRIKGGQVTAFGTAEGLPPGRGSTSVASDARGELWFSRGSQVGLFRDGELHTKLTLNETPVRVCGAASAGLWICAGSQLLKYVEGHEPKEHGRLPGKIEPRVLFEDHSGALWIGTAADGLFRFKDSGLEKVPTSHQEVNCLAEDREGNIWAGTGGGGLNLIQPRAVTLFGREAGLPFESVRSVCEDAAGDIWVALQNGMLARGRNGSWSQVKTEAGWTGGDATCVAADRQGGVWVGTRDRGLQSQRDGVWRVWRRPEGLGSDSVRSILVAADGDVWVATASPNRLFLLRDGKLHALEMHGPTRSIRAMAEGANGTIWIGTSEGQILRVSGQALVSEAAATGPTQLSVRSLHSTPDGALWIGYAGYGVGYLKDGRHARVTAAAGLMDDYPSQILADGRGTMWIAGNHGLFQVRLSELVEVAEGRAERLRSRVFGRSEGLASLQPNFDNFPAVCQAKDGRLWFSMRSGLLMVQPDNVADHPDPPPVLLERVAVDDYPVGLYSSHSPSQTRGAGGLLDLSQPAAALPIPPAHRKLEFDFAALSFASPENVHFRYRLSNFDENWIEAGSQRRAAYPRLPAGNYEFRVLACNNAGVWNETGAALALVVSPFFWQTWWFRSLALVLFTASVIAVVRYVSFRRLRARMQQLEQQAALHKERVRIARDMHDEVGAKLTRLSLLSDMATGQPELPAAARAEVKEISDTARDTIRSFEEIVWAVNPRNDTLADLAHYLCRYAEDFFEGSPVECAFDLPPELPAVTLSTEARHQIFLAAKEALNNALKHARARQVCIRVTLRQGEFGIAVEDDGCGFDSGAPPKRAGAGNGLDNMRERLRSVGGRFECQSQPGQGTRILFHMPAQAAVAG